MDDYFMSQKLEILAMERDLKNKLDLYQRYIDNNQEPPRELLGSIQSLERCIESSKNALRSMRMDEWRNNDKRNGK